jgi:uncharacterized protein YqeY
MVTDVGNEAIRDRLQRALRAALRARDRAATSALRSALAAIDNASAVPKDSRLRQEGSVLASALAPDTRR